MAAGKEVNRGVALREILLTLASGGGNIPVECVGVSMQDLADIERLNEPGAAE
jgi:hypothetical protein